MNVNQQSNEPTPIESIDFSYRTYNCLRRFGINTLEELMNTTDEDLKQIRNFGRKSLEEVNNFKSTYEQMMKEKNGQTSESTPIESINFSPRTYNCIKRGGINTLEELMNTTDEELMRFRNLSRKSLLEVNNFKSTLNN